MTMSAAAKDNTDVGLRFVWGLLLVALCLFISLSVFSYDWRDISLLNVPTSSPPSNLIGPVGAWLSFGLFILFGLGAYLAPLWCLGLGMILIVSKEDRVWPKAVWLLALMFGFSAVIELHAAWWGGTCIRLNVHDAGGLFSRVVMRGLLVRWLSPVGAGIVIWSLIVLSAIMAVGRRNLVRAALALSVGYRAAVVRLRAAIEERRDRHTQIEKEERQLERRRRHLEKEIRKQEREAQASLPGEKRESTLRPAKTCEPEPEPAPDEDPAPPPAPEPLPAPRRETGDYHLPPVDLLNAVSPVSLRGMESDSGTTSRILVETLAEFGIEAEVTNVERGPVVTRYELLPAPGVRVERISGLSNNLALSLKATSVRVQAPIPGKGVVGIEVPNNIANMVALREILEGEMWTVGKAKLPLVLGKDVGGNDLVADLADMPHLLIAGATGAGKTVCMNSVLAGLLMSRTPDELRLLLVDPKIVEFSVYNNLPHLVVPVVTDPKKVSIALRWAINEMEKRYKLFARTGVRNIESYNKREVAKQTDLFEGDAGAEPKCDPDTPDTVPYVVIVIDELADLMLTDQAGIENAVARLAQLSRAVGIHMILSTQRPSVNVITGTIKANFPARIAFQVAQKVDSRTILDTVGAEKLLGRGDMLFLPPGASKVLRAQGAMTTDEEIRKIVDFVKRQGEPDFEIEIQEKMGKQTMGSLDGGEDDDLLAQAVEIIRETRRASTSSLQRRLRIGYTRAARMMDILEERGIVGPPCGSDPREILIDLDGQIPDNSSEPEEE